MRRHLAMIPLAAIAGAGVAAARTYILPAAEPQIADGGPAAEIVAGHCAACHSLDYITTQPPGRGRDFWQAEVTKMVTVYGAPIPREDAAKVVDYLAEALP